MKHRELVWHTRGAKRIVAHERHNCSHVAFTGALTTETSAVQWCVVAMMRRWARATRTQVSPLGPGLLEQAKWSPVQRKQHGV